MLEDKCQLYKKASTEDHHSSTYLKELEARCLRLQQQISDMEVCVPIGANFSLQPKVITRLSNAAAVSIFFCQDFLLDYGMVWVGQQSDEDDDDLEDSAMQRLGGMDIHCGSYFQILILKLCQHSLCPLTDNSLMDKVLFQVTLGLRVTLSLLKLRPQRIRIKLISIS